MPVFLLSCLFGYYLGSFVDSVSPWVDASPEVGQTVAFCSLGLFLIIHVFNVRSSRSIFQVKLSSNKSLFEMGGFGNFDYDGNCVVTIYSRII